MTTTCNGRNKELPSSGSFPRKMCVPQRPGVLYQAAQVHMEEKREHLKRSLGLRCDGASFPEQDSKLLSAL